MLNKLDLAEIFAALHGMSHFTQIWGMRRNWHFGVRRVVKNFSRWASFSRTGYQTKFQFRFRNAGNLGFRSVIGERAEGRDDVPVKNRPTFLPQISAKTEHFVTETGSNDRF